MTNTRHATLALLLFAGTVAACGTSVDYEVLRETPADLGMTNLVIEAPAGAEESDLAEILSDLYTERVEGDYRIVIRCPDGRLTARGFLRNSDDRRELRTAGPGQGSCPE